MSYILDIGTGSGCIALMLAQRTPPNTLIDAIEIDNMAAQQAQQNVWQSPWPKKVTIIGQSLQDFVSHNTPKQYDLIVCNPPYFQNSLKTPDKQRNLARHTDSLSFAELTQYAALLLQPNGLFCVVLPFDSYASFSQLAQYNGLFLQLKTLVYTRTNKAPKRVLLALGKNAIQQLLHPETMPKKLSILEATPNNAYTHEYRQLTADFYRDF